jgi:hypothetical protein
MHIGRSESLLAEFEKNSKLTILDQAKVTDVSNRIIRWLKNFELACTLLSYFYEV